MLAMYCVNRDAQGYNTKTPRVEVNAWRSFRQHLLSSSLEKTSAVTLNRIHPKIVVRLRVDSVRDTEDRGEDKKCSYPVR